MIAAINTLAVSIVSYSYGVITWKLDEIQEPDKIIRKQLCMNQMLAKKADTDRIYLPYQENGRGLMNLEKEYKAAIVGLYQYMVNNEDAQISALPRHHTGKALYSVSKEATEYLNIRRYRRYPTLTATKGTRKLKGKHKRDFKKMMKDKWSEKPMHGKFPNHLGKNIYTNKSHSSG